MAVTSSPWGKTGINRSGGYLNILNIRPVPADPDDQVYEIQSQYHQRPDLLAYDMYGNPKLWWVYAQRNMDILKDPVFIHPNLKGYYVWQSSWTGKLDPQDDEIKLGVQITPFDEVYKFYQYLILFFLFLRFFFYFQYILNNSFFYLCFSK